MHQLLLYWLYLQLRECSLEIQHQTTANVSILFSSSRQETNILYRIRQGRLIYQHRPTRLRLVRIRFQ
jgi:hypothetical protein